MQSVKLDPEATRAYVDNVRDNTRNQVEYWQQRTEDTLELLLDTVALMAAICVEVRTDLELLRVHKAQRSDDSTDGR